MANTPSSAFNDKARAKKLAQLLSKSLDFFAGELDAVSFIQQGADLSLRDKDGNSFLIKAVAANKEFAVTALLERGASLTETNKLNRNALTCAVLYGHKKIATVLMSYGARLTAAETVELTLACAENANAPKALDCLRHVAAEQDKLQTSFTTAKPAAFTKK